MTCKTKLKTAILSSLSAAALTTLLAPAPAEAAFSGIYYDHTGRSAIRVSPCGSGLCGKIVWVKSKANAKGCGLRIIGGGKKVGNSYDTGWIYNPDNGRKYNVEVTPQGSSLKVVGYAGSKLLSKTMIWRRAPSGLELCGKTRSITVGKPTLLDLGWGKFPEATQ